MSLEAWGVLAVTAAVLGLLARTQIAPYLILLGAIVSLLVIGILPYQDVLVGFSNPGVATVAALFVVVAGLKQTGILSHLVQRLLGRPGSVLGAQARLILPVILISTFLNNTPVVAMLAPVVLEWAKSIRVSASKLLIPLSYAAVLGGMCSMIGTSTNLVINGLLIQSGKDGLGLFDITWVGLPAATVGAVYLLIFGRKLLPFRGAMDLPAENPREYTVEMTVADRGPLVGRSIQEAGLRHLPGVYLMEIDRRGRVIPAVRPDEVLESGDQLIFVGMVDAIGEMQRIPGLAPATHQVFKMDSPRSQRVFAEAVVSRTSPLVGRTIREGRFRTRYNAVVLAVSRSGKRVRQRIGDIVLEPGDALFLETTPSFVEQQRNVADFYLVSQLEKDGPPSPERAWIASAILVGMMAAAATGVLSMLQAALLAAGLMLITRCCTEETARRSVDLSLLVAIAAALGLGRALETTGVARAVAEALLQIGGPHPLVALAIVYGITMVLTELVTNSAAAVAVFPIAMAAAAQLGTSHLPFVMAIMISASAGFASPMGYQTHLIVYGAGGYRFGDFVRIGLPLNLLLWLTTVLVAPWVWPF
jgi:di/tricarboxylate transporter